MKERERKDREMKENERNISANLGIQGYSFKGTGSRDRFEKIPRKWTGLGLKKGREKVFMFFKGSSVIPKMEEKNPLR